MFWYFSILVKSLNDILEGYLIPERKNPHKGFFLSPALSLLLVYNEKMHIGELLRNRVIKKRGTRWTDMVKECMDIINEERRGTKYKKLSFVVVRNKVEHLDDDSLAYFISICKDAKNRKTTNEHGVVIQGSFSKVFFGALKNGNTTRTGNEDTGGRKGGVG